jgi:hypothetical protein
MECVGCRSELTEGTSFCPSCGTRTALTASRPADPLRHRLQNAVESEYVLIRLLGRGGMGAVYLAREIALDRLVAIKVLPPDAADTRDRRARFLREAQLAAKLSHPNIVPLHSFGEKDGVSYYVMGYVRGESLADRIRREGRIPHDETRLMLAQLADALEYAHAKGVIHREIKPDNILLDDETGRPLLADFGIAKATGAGATDIEASGVAGTLHYMSPEQATGTASIDGRSDFYALGVVGYMMLAGQTPFAAASFGAFVTEQANADPPPLVSHAPEVPADLAAAIMRCLARDAAERWPDARAFKDALGAPLDDDPDRLPGELREVASALFYSVAAGWLLANIASYLFAASTNKWMFVSLAGIGLAVPFLATAAFHHVNGTAWAEMGRVSLWPPGWWPFWWPTAWRRPGDVWTRLPRTVRVLRLLYGALVIIVVLALPLGVRRETLNVFLGIVAGGWGVLAALMLFTAWWAYRSGIPNNADLRSLFFRSPADRRFWRRPQMARRLLPLEPAGLGGTPQTPAEYVRSLAEATQQMPLHARETGVRAVEAARLACAAIEVLDGEFEQLRQDVDVDDAAVLEHRSAIASRRAHISDLLKALWGEQVLMSREKGAAAVHRFSGVVASFAQEIVACGTPDGLGDSVTMSPTSAEVTGTDVTRPAGSQRSP